VDFSSAGSLLFEDQTQEARFSRPRSPHKENKLSRGNIDAHIVQGGFGRTPIHFGDVFEEDHVALSLDSRGLQTLLRHSIGTLAPADTRLQEPVQIAIKNGAWVVDFVL